MSYEGYNEFLCENGHYDHVDCREPDPKTCARCGATMAFWNSVDTTNGYDEDLPCSVPAEKVETGTVAVMVHIPIYEPAPGSRWSRIGKPSGGPPA